MKRSARSGKLRRDRQRGGDEEEEEAGCERLVCRNPHAAEEADEECLANGDPVEGERHEQDEEEERAHHVVDPWAEVDAHCLSRRPDRQHPDGLDRGREDEDRDQQADVTFLPTQYEAGAVAAAGPLPVDVRLTISPIDATTTVDAAKARAVTVLGPVVAGATSIGPDVVQSALAAEAGFAAIAAETVVTVEHLPGEFTEVRPGDPPFAAPAGGSFLLRDVTATGAG